MTEISPELYRSVSDKVKHHVASQNEPHGEQSKTLSQTVEPKMGLMSCESNKEVRLFLLEYKYLLIFNVIGVFTQTYLFFPASFLRPALSATSGNVTDVKNDSSRFQQAEYTNVMELLPAVVTFL